MFKALLTASACVALLAVPALAAKRGFSIPIMGMEINPEAAISASGVTLKKRAGTQSKFIFNYVLPPDYKPGTVVKLRLFISNATDAACNAVIVPYTAIRQRAGKGAVTVFPPSDRITPANGSYTVIIPKALSFDIPAVVSKTFEVRGSLKPGFTGQKPGDAMTLVFQRQSQNIDDTCATDILVRQLEVRYTGR